MASIRNSSAPILLFFRISIVALLLCCLLGCERGVQKRPIGWFRLGKLADLTSTEINIAEKLVLLRRDAAGFYVMSTACTYDLSPLIVRDGPQGRRFVSMYSESEYDDMGRVLHGPAKADLPFFDMKVDEGVAGGPKDTLYVQVGVEKPREWRLPVPAQ